MALQASIMRSPRQHNIHFRFAAPQRKEKGGYLEFAADSSSLLILLSLLAPLFGLSSCDRHAGNLLPVDHDVRVAGYIAADPGGVPVETFFRNPDRTEFKLSPDGEHIAWLSPYEGRMNIFVQHVDSMAFEALRLTDEEQTDLRRFFWANNESILFIKDDRGNENFRLYSVNFKEKHVTDLTPFDDVMIEIVDELPDVPSEVIISMNKRNPRLFEPYRLNIENGEMKRLANNTNIREPYTWWVTDHEGQIRIAFSLTDGTRTNVLYRDNENEEFRKVLTTGWTETMYPLFFDFDNHHVIASSNLGRDKSAIVRYDMVNGVEKEILFEHPEVDVYDCGYSRERELITWVGYAHDKWKTVFLDSAAQRLFDRVEALLGTEDEIKITSIDELERRFVIRTYSDRSLGTWYLYDRIEDELLELAEVNQDIRPEDMAEMKPISYQSRDGLTIHGYLTCPRGAEASDLPVVVYPHAGPRLRNYWGFQPDAQLLANRGYAVLQMNYRGSTGYGRSFADAGFGQWGEGIQNDITDGAQWLIEEGIADPDRIAIYGFGFGGYCALAGLTQNPELYACGVDNSGFPDLLHLLDSIPTRWEAYREMLYQMAGNPETDSARLAAASPARHLDQIEVPLMVAQGGRDPRVPVWQSRQMIEELQELGKSEVTYFLVEEEGHGLRSEESRFAFHTALVGFLNEHLGPGVELSASEEVLP